MPLLRRAKVTEMLDYCGADQEHQIHNPKLTITHTPDPSKNRMKYLELMELAFQENPESHRIAHQLGRDYIQYGFYDKCIKTMEYTMNLKDISPDQKRACKRFIARAYGEKQEYIKAKNSLQELIAEAPHCGSAYIEHAILAYKNNQWKDILQLANQCSNINWHYRSIYNEFSNSESTFYDIISIAYYQVSDYKKALYYAKKAFVKDKNNQRLKKNIEYYSLILKAK